MIAGAPLHNVVSMQIGRYVLREEIASGGMATVYLGHAKGAYGFTRVVAVKALHRQFASDPAFVAMLTDEARMTSRICHPNVVPTLDVVQQGSELFIVMDYVAGETLARLVGIARRASTVIPVPIVAAIVCDCLSGLHAAHDAVGADGLALELVHRDVSPQNIIVGADGDTRVLDFGVAKARGRVQVTSDGAVKGKLGYMPPEQLLGEAVDRRTDVYAAGVVLWEALTGERLYGPDTPFGALVESVIDPPSTFVPGIPAALDAVVLRALARSPDDRYPTARAMVDAIQAATTVATRSEVQAFVTNLAAATLVQQARQVESLETREAGEHLETCAAPSTATPPARRTRRHVGFLVVAAVLVVAALVPSMRRSRAADGADPPASASAPPSAAIALTAERSAPVERAPDTAPETVPELRAPAPSASASAAATAAPRPRPALCDPPWVIGPDGHKSYKRSCLQ